MNIQEFDLQVNRLKDCFGDRSYSDERVKVIWKEVKDLNGKWFSRVVDRFIGEERQAPLMPQFREEIAIERERLWKIEKEVHAKDAKEFFRSVYHPDDERMICQKIVERITGKMSNDDFTQFIKLLEETPRAAKVIPMVKCQECGDSGLVVDRKNYAYRCYCAQGLKRQEKYPIYQR
jgi:hypothetical protein